MKNYSSRQRSSSNRQLESRIRRQQLYRQEVESDQRQFFGETSYNMAQSQQLHHQADLNFSSLVKMLTIHYINVEKCFKEIQIQMTKLETKIADCFGKFNKIQWKIGKGVYQIQQAKMLNSDLLNINQQIEKKLESVKKDYQQLKKKKYMSNLQKRMDQLKEYVHKLQIQQYKNKFNKHQHIIFQDNIDRLQQLVNKIHQKKDNGAEREIYNQIIKDLIKFLKGKGDISEWISQKIHENINMKFRIIKNQSKSQL